MTLLADMDPSGGAPKELFEVIDPDDVPVVCGGRDTSRIQYLLGVEDNWNVNKEILVDILKNASYYIISSFYVYTENSIL